MSSRTRLEAVFKGEQPDRTPILGGWIACPEHICAITRKTLQEYWNDPIAASIAAYKALGTDGLIDIYVPKSTSDFRFVDIDDYWHKNEKLSVEQALTSIDEMPSPDAVARGFDFTASYDSFKAELQRYQLLCRDMLYMPAQWDNTPRIIWSELLGYESFFTVLGLAPDRVEKLIEISSVKAYQRNTLVARAVEEGLYPHAVLFGEDICNQRGLMISPDLVEQYYLPRLRYCLEPLLAVGCKPVWHSDGNVRPIVDMLIDAGIRGFQGFQTECGVTLEFFAGKRTSENEPLLIFGPLSVATELTKFTSEQVYRKVRESVEICRGNASLVVFTSNTVNPDVPLENIYAMYQAVLDE